MLLVALERDLVGFRCKRRSVPTHRYLDELPTTVAQISTSMQERYPLLRNALCNVVSSRTALVPITTCA